MIFVTIVYKRIGMKRNEQGLNMDRNQYEETSGNASNTGGGAGEEWVSSETNSTDYPLSAEDVNDPSQEGSVAVGSGLGIDE
jgi:hypothetical protein